MPITALATANTTIGPAQYADMAQALAPRFLVDTPTALQPSVSGTTVSLATGGALVAGTRLRLSGTTSVALPALTFYQRTYAVIIRVDWSKGTNDAATLTYLPWASNVVNTTSSTDTTKVNRIPGVMYDAVVALVTQASGMATQIKDLRAWGGDGGPLRVTQAGLDNPTLLDARAGTMISTERGQYTKRLDSDGVWRDVGTPSNPWKLWTPTFRYYGKDAPNGTTGGTPVTLGTQGTYSGRYRVVDGMLDGFVHVTTGTGNQFGTGAITLDLPLPCAGWQTDTWSMGHIFTSMANGGDRLLDWHAEVLVKADWTRGMIFAPHSGDFNNLEVHWSAAPWDVSTGPAGAAGTGIPRINNGWSVGDVYTFHLTYPVA